LAVDADADINVDFDVDVAAGVAAYPVASLTVMQLQYKKNKKEAKYLRAWLLNGERARQSDRSKFERGCRRPR